MNESDDSAGPVSLVDLIDRLAEPVEPPPASMVPQTAGWVVAAVLLAALAAWLAWRMVRDWRRNAYRRAALAEISACGDDPVAIAGILRRTALAAFPRTEVASLTGADWLDFLDRTGGAGEFSGGAGQVILTAPYEAEPAPAPDLNTLAARWIRKHSAAVGVAEPRP